MKSLSAVNKSTAWRSPAVGIVPPKSSVVVSIQVPIDLNKEQPIVITFKNKGMLFVRDTTPTHVVLENTSNKFVPYALFVVSKAALSLPKMNWRDRLQMFAQKLMKDLPIKDPTKG